MAEKEANIFIIDLGRSMGQKRHGRELSDLDYSLQYVWDKITNYIYLGRKTLFTGIIGFRTVKTRNHMQEEGGYDNITVIQAIQNITMPELRKLPDQLHANSTDSGDALSAVILGVDMIMKYCRDLKFIKHLYLVTNGTGALDADDIEEVAAQIKQCNIQLTVLGVDFDDPEYGFKEENKPYSKRENEQALKRLVDISDGVYGTMQEAIEGLARPHVKAVRPTPTYKGQLRLGDPTAYDTAITIDIERYFKVSVARPKTASAYVTRDGASQATDGDNLANVRNAYAYSVLDESAPGGKKDVPREELAKGYSYGRTAVHIADSEENITRLETEQNYEILGFIPQENVERYMFLDNTNMIVAQKVNDKAAFALSSLVHALYEAGSVAIARFVKKDSVPPQLTVLSPYITAEIECLIENDLPFAEDIRQYRFPPLDKILTVSGKTLTSHRNLPSADLMDAMSDYVDSMSLVNKDIDPPEERFAMEDVFSPLLHTIEGAIKHRAVHVSEPLPSKPEILLQPSHPPAELFENAKLSLDRLIQVADVKKVPPKKKGRFRMRDTEKPLSGLDVDALLRKSPGPSGATNMTKIDPKNAIPDFKRFMDQSDNAEEVKEVVNQMSKIVEDLITSSFGEQHYSQAIEILGVVRSEMIEFGWPEYYNELLKTLKSKVIKEQLGGNRQEFWRQFRMVKLGLIDNTQADTSKVTKEEAKTFLNARD